MQDGVEALPDVDFVSKIVLSVPSPAKWLQRTMTNETKLALARVGQATVGALLDDCDHPGLASRI